MVELNTMLKTKKEKRNFLERIIYLMAIQFRRQGKGKKENVHPVLS